MRTLTRPGYEEDFYAWALDQAERLRAQAALRPNEPLDWENLAEEIEGLARSDWRSCASLLEQILIHLLELAYSTAEEPRGHWMAEVMTFRLRLRDILTPSLRNRLQRELDERYRNALRVLTLKAARYEPALLARLPETCPWTFEQVVGDFFPEPPSPPTDRA
ncbi:MAG: hypothetical protein KatS3mg117_1607 [Geminicoccaceae bacterium]|nr:MAG: hypothetical protein KatS3mg117_1607 [Geminicoccaceae bacterium]